MSAVRKQQDDCYNALFTSFIASYLLCGMSLLTLTAISVDRLLALTLGLRYRQVVTVKKACACVIMFWIVSIIFSAMYAQNVRITIWYSHIEIQVRGNIIQRVQSSNSSSAPLNISQYRKGVSSVIWLQVAVAVCYLPHGIITALWTYSGQSSAIIVLRQFTITLVYFNSSLNPLLYCWKISEMRQSETSNFRLDMSTSFLNLTGDEQQKTLGQLICSAAVTNGTVPAQVVYLAVMNIILSIIAILENTLILLALHKESSLHPPSKLLLRSLATTDLCVGLIAQPVYASYQISLAQGHWSVCRFKFDISFLAGYILCSVSLWTISAISVDRLLALSLGIRYRQVVTLKRANILVFTF
ncbi:unnamed protein product [Pocillopora meandrina]|uniref:G-protein coupled receptors family 1 profile domain-containing protein n=1 Tax=Pocillopora meandrina TaxID=46732 RepID=A0AAU9XVN1_9CNID|nr:unnamed protein product [Pocillopora meandrina]